jgi:hypothetical protein
MRASAQELRFRRELADGVLSPQKTVDGWIAVARARKGRTASSGGCLHRPAGEHCRRPDRQGLEPERRGLAAAAGEDRSIQTIRFRQRRLRQALADGGDAEHAALG